MKIIFSIVFITFSILNFAQEVPKQDSAATKISVYEEPPKNESEILSEIQAVNTPAKAEKYNPTKAGLYSAVLPGLGQYYNKKYWKIPIVWGAVGTGVGIALWNDKQYRRYRDAFVAQLNGVSHEFSDIKGITPEALGRAQDRMKRQRDYAIAVTGLIYVLNIIDAVVDAHLYEGRHDPDLALQPTVIYDEYSQHTSKAGLSLSFRF